MLKSPKSSLEMEGKSLLLTANEGEPYPDQRSLELKSWLEVGDQMVKYFLVLVYIILDKPILTMPIIKELKVL